MENRKYSTKIFTALFIVAALICAILFYKDSKQALFDAGSYKEIASDLEQAAPELTSNEELCDYITGWADENDLSYTKDHYGNIIFTSAARNSKKSVDPIIICVDYNYKTAGLDISSLASAQMVALSGISSGKYSVIFFNNDNDYYSGYKNISSKYFPDYAKVIYLDSNEYSTYASSNSFSEVRASYVINNKMQARTCDTMIKLHISGATTDDVNNHIGSQPSPISAFGTVLNKLKSKSIPYQIANIKVGSEGNMYASSLDVDILINSSNLETITKYIDDRADNFIDEYRSDYPEIDYSYTVVNNESKMPDKCYSKRTCQSLNNILYTFNDGTYRFTKDDVPSDYDVKDIYGINCIENITSDDNHITVDICTQGLNSAYTKQIVKENKTIAGFSDAKYVTKSSIGSFSGHSSSLYRILNFTYFKVTFNTTGLSDKDDTYFTPCSYLSKINDSMNIIHISMDDKRAKIITNTLLVYIDSIGNFLSI